MCVNHRFIIKSFIFRNNGENRDSVMVSEMFKSLFFFSRQTSMSMCRTSAVEWMETFQLYSLHKEFRLSFIIKRHLTLITINFKRSHVNWGNIFLSESMCSLTSIWCSDAANELFHLLLKHLVQNTSHTIRESAAAGTVQYVSRFFLIVLCTNSERRNTSTEGCKWRLPNSFLYLRFHVSVKCTYNHYKPCQRIKWQQDNVKPLQTCTGWISPWPPLSCRDKTLGPLLDPLLVLWVLASSWRMITFSLMRQE